MHANKNCWQPQFRPLSMICFCLTVTVDSVESPRPTASRWLIFLDFLAFLGFFLNIFWAHTLGRGDQCDIQVVWSLQDLCVIVRHSPHRWKHQPHKRKPAKVVASLSNYKLRSQNVRKINPTVNVVATLLACQVTAALLWWLLCPAREPLASITDKPPFVDLSPQFSFYRVLCLKRCLHCVFSFSVSCR